MNVVSFTDSVPGPPGANEDTISTITGGTAGQRLIIRNVGTGKIKFANTESGATNTLVEPSLRNHILS